jgi:hypothetical protein
MFVEIAANDCSLGWRARVFDALQCASHLLVWGVSRQCQTGHDHPEVNNLKPFACLAVPQTSRPVFGDELVTSFHRGSEYISSLQSFGTAPS